MIIQGDCLGRLGEIEDSTVDLICTDPPYALTSIVKRFGKENSAKAQYGKDGSFQRLSGGFMGQMWDSQTPSVETWKECLRVLKPGAFAFICMSPRQDSYAETIGRLAEAGFNVSFTSIYWTYASGFPKASNISKMIDKREGVDDKREFLCKNPANRPCNKDGNYITSTGWKLSPLPDKTKPYSDDAKRFDGAYGGFQPKPAVEVILVAMKPLTEKTFVEQALKNGHGIAWFDDVRIPYQNDKEINDRKRGMVRTTMPEYAIKCGVNRKPTQKPFDSDEYINDNGRFPANLIVSDDVLNNNISKDKPSAGIRTQKFYDKTSNKPGGADGQTEWIPDNTGRFPANLIVSDDILNDGNITGGSETKITKVGKGRGMLGQYDGRKKMPEADENMKMIRVIGDSGSYSRYFDLDEWFKQNLPESVQKTFPYLIVPKASKGEKNLGLDGLEDKLFGQSGGAQQTLKDGKTEYLQKGHIGLNKIKVVKNNHPTVKPVKLFAYLITMGSREGDIVLDPFMGSGTTGIAAKLLNRNFIGIELSEEYISIAEPRIEVYEDYRRFIIEKPKEDHFSNKSKNKPKTNKFIDIE